MEPQRQLAEACRDRRHRWVWPAVAVGVLAWAAILLTALAPGARADGAAAAAVAPPPHSAARYRAQLTRAAHTQWGLDAPVATFAAQVHQESGWRPEAVSRAGAQGMAQFMPATAAWWCELHRMAPADCQPHNPTWALRALVGYDRWLWQRIGAADDCQRMAMTLAAYNGGLGWIHRDQRLASSKGLDSRQYFGAVDTVNAGRADWAIRENRDYPRRILLQHAPRYQGAGWGRSAC